MKYVESGGRSRTVTYTYDSKNNLTSVSDTYSGATSRYTYDEDNRVEAVSDGNSSIHYSYDSFGRVSQEQTKRRSSAVVTDSYTFRNPTSTTTSTQVATHTIAASGLNATYTYTYDNNGNITSVSDGTYTTSYVYDSQNQLIRENNQKANKTWTWEYDGAGNILNRKEYSYTTGTLGTAASTKAYGYGDSEWGDLLTNYNGKAITYDEIGNMLTYGSKTFTWERGRELAAIDDWQMTYAADGMRLKRYNSSSGMFYTYYYRGDQLTGMLFYNDEIDGALTFYYDANGTISFAEYYIHEAIDGNCYFGDFYYVTNLQGDVIALVAENGNKLAEYTYDAWGCPLSTSYYSYGYDIAYYNPLRYRGYVYDIETGLYYLQSRYYDPEIGRFINADSYVATGQGLLGNNMFAYCNNSPVIYKDSQGTAVETVFDLFSLGTSILEVVNNPNDLWAWAGLVGDAVDLIPFVTGVGEVTRAVKTIDKVADVVDDVVETADAVYDTSKHVDFYVTPAGDAIPSTLSSFNDNLSKMENINGKYYGYDSRGPVRVRVEMHKKKLDFNGPLNPYHEMPHFHIDRRSKGTSGSWIEKFTDFLGRLF